MLLSNIKYDLKDTSQWNELFLFNLATNVESVPGTVLSVITSEVFDSPDTHLIWP